MTDLSEILDTVRRVQPDDRAALAEIMWHYAEGKLLTPRELTDMRAMREKIGR